MTSVLSEVLHEKQNASKEEIHAVILKIESKIISMTTDVNESLESCFVMNESDVDRVVAWSADVHQTKAEAEDLMQRFDVERRLYESSTEEMNDLEEQLGFAVRDIKRLNSVIGIVEDLETLQLHSDIGEASVKVKRASDGLKLLMEELEGQNIGEWVQHLEDLIEDQVHLIREIVTKDWNSKFHFRKHQLVIDQYGTSVDVMIKSLRNIGHWDAVWSRFMSQLWTDLLSKICTPDYSVRVTNPPARDNLESSTANISLNNTTTKQDTVTSPAFNVTMKKDRCLIDIEHSRPPLTSIDGILRGVIQVLHTLFLTLPDAFKKELMGNLGRTLGNRMCSTLSTKCLKPMILNNSNGDIQLAQAGLKSLTGFIQALYKLGYSLPEDGQVQLESFIANFDTLFRAQLKEDICRKSRDLIRAEVSKTVKHNPAIQISPTTTRNPLELTKSPLMLNQPMEISTSIFDMVKELIDHITNYPEDNAIPANVLHMYLAIVNIPKHDSDVTFLTPLQAAIIHNNSFFLAHHASVTFDYCEHNIMPLRQKADVAMAYMMRTIRSKLNSMIQSAFSGLEEKVEASEDISLGFLRLAEELQILNELFKDVLPPRVWMTVLAVFLDHTVHELVNRVLSWDDINAKTAADVADAFNKFAVEASYLFKGTATSRKEIDYRVSKCCKHWNRFGLLSFVLTASMAEIGDKWVDGMGPLALAYTADEVRRLVRALFQNTDRRAAFLSGIK